MRVTKRRARKATLGALIVVAGSVAMIPAGEAQAAPGPRFGENYVLPPVEPGRARDVPGLAVNPADQNHIVEAEGDPLNLQCDFHASFDGGRTWTGGHLTIRNSGENPAFPTPACDVNFDSGGYHHFNTGIVFGSGQNVYITFSAHRGTFNRPESNAFGGDGDDSVVARSTDGGRTFAPAVVAVPGGGPVAATPGLAGRGMRPGLAVQRGAGTGGADRLYVASWNCRTVGGCSGGAGDRRFLVARSDDGGATWNAPAVASRTNVRSGADATTAGSTDEQTREPSQPVVGPDGAVYMAGRNRDTVTGSTCPPNPVLPANCIAIYRSTDQGQTWQQFNTGTVSGAGHPRLAIDPSTPAGVGTLYVAYQRSVPGPPADSADIALQSSTDRGQTWSPPVRVNDDPPGFTQTNAWPSVGPGGRVDVTWRDSRLSYPGGTTPNTMHDIYYARSTNGGTSFGPNRRVTDRSINPGTGRMGDYGTYTWYGAVSLPLADGSILTAWPDSREGNFDNGFQDVYLSRLEPGAGIASKQIATATPGGLSVRLSRLAYPGGSEALGAENPVTRVVVANQGDLPGALAGSVLARANWAPLLLSPADALPAIVRAESARLKPDGAFIIGDAATLSPAVSSSITGTTRNGENVTRVAAPVSTAVADRPAETARRVAELMRPLPGGASPEAVIANPKTPEAAAAASLAAALKLPILFVDERTGIPGPTNTAISALGIKKLLIVGGPTSVNPTVETALTTAVGAGGTVKRLSGTNASDTSEAVLGEARLRGLPANVVYVADGARPVEGAALGAAVGRVNGLQLLTAGGSTSAAESRVGALGLDGAVDRIVGAIGTGGSDPALPASPAGGGGAPVGAGYPLPPANLALAGCPGAASAQNLVVMSNGNDTQNGTAGPDRIFAGAGNDVVDALGGDDCVDLGPGTDRGQGGSGDDFVQGGTDSDVISGGTGKDNLRGFLGNDSLSGNAGDDLIVGGIGNDRITGATGNDSLRGESGKDRISGGTGRDRISGAGGNDSLKGDGGADTITGGSGRDSISGGSGADRISAVDGVRDKINCGTGRDRVTADRTDRVSRNCERVRRR